MPAVSLFFDTNVLVSALMFGGKHGVILDCARRGECEGAISLHVLSELFAVLMGPRFGMAESAVGDLADVLSEFMTVVPLLVADAQHVSDPNDDPVIEAALAAGSTYIVTGDTAILGAVGLPVPAVSTASALRLLSGE